ncbi:hypothetical protein Gpo141_00006947 [Globisporangium polare]
MDSLLDAGTSSSHRFASSSCAPPPVRRTTVFSNGGGSAAYVDSMDQRSDFAPPPPSSVDRGADRSVELADDEVRMLTTLADTLLVRLKASYEAHAFASHLRVDKKQWKAIKKREQLTVYKQKAGSASSALSEPGNDEDKDDEDEDDANTTPTTTTTAADSSDDEPSATTTSSAASGKKNKSESAKTTKAVPQLMLTGSVAGRVEDALYGLSSATSLAMKFRSSYTQDAVVDAQVLTTIQGPTVDDPFRFLGLKWALQNHASSASPSTTLFKKRDVVFLESTGLTTLQSTGDVVGFHIVHSVLLNSRARMLNINNSNSTAPVVRAKTSMGHLFHQRSSGSGESVDVFMRGYYDPSGGMLHFLAVNLAAEMLLHTATSSLECAQLKKLSWAAHQSSRKRRATTLSRATRTMIMGQSMHSDRDTGAMMLQEMAAAAREVDAEQARLANKCAICSRKYGKLLTRGGAACTICSQMVCSRCSVAKKLSFTRNDDNSQQQQFEQEQLVADLERSGIDLSSSRFGGGGGSVTGSVKSRASSLAASARRSSRSQVQQEICQKSMNFCIPCIVLTTKQSAAHVAVEEILEQQAVLATSCMSGGTPVSATPRQVLAMAAANLQQQQVHRRRTTRTDSAQFYGGGGSTTTTPRYTYQMTSTATTPAAANASRKPRPKAFSTSSTSSSTTSSVILYEEPTAIDT